MNERSGYYVLQHTGNKAFIPKNLPPTPPVKMSDELIEALIQAERKLSILNGVGFSLPNPDLFITMMVRKEALLSSQIEGTQATMTDVLTYETWEEVDNFDDVQEVVNYIQALHHGRKRLNELPLCFRVVKEIHKVLLNSVRGADKTPGEFRRSQNWIGPSLKDTIFIPPPQDTVAEFIGSLEKFINEEDSIPLLVKCSLIHYQFETIHPFLDGNGRIGRLLIDLFFLWKNLLNQPLLYTSLFFKQNRQEYFDRLMLVRQKGHFEQWIHFFLRAVAWSSEQALEKIHHILSLQDQLKKQLIQAKGSSIRSIQLLDILFDHPLIGIHDIEEKLKVSFQTASSQVNFFVKQGLLKELTKQKRKRRFAFAPYLEIIED